LNRLTTRRVTVQDVADYCGLSKSTVAYVLREPKTCKATEKTKVKVAEAVKKLGYRTNPAARALSTRRYNSIGVLLPPLGGHYTELTIELDKELRRKNYFGVFSFWDAADSDKSFKKGLQHLLANGIDGIITVKYDEYLYKLNIPVVIFGNKWPSCDCVYPDKVAYMEETVKYLYDHNHHKIGFFGLTHEIRAKTLRKELEKYELPVNEDWFVDCWGIPEHGKKAMEKLLTLDERPDAIILHSDFMAPGVLSVAAQAGIKIPEDISLISYDNLEESNYCIPALTTFDQCLATAAKMLTKAMLTRLRTPEIPQQAFSYKMPLVERKSVIYR
jgi:LacI family transcriptional regulator